VTTGGGAFLCDAGFAFCADGTVANIRAALAEWSGEGAAPGDDLMRGEPAARGQLSYILLTHSHFDHASGAPAVSKAFPEAKIIASAYAAEVFTRPGARRAIRDMDAAAARNAGAEPGVDMTSDLRVDIAVNDGDVIEAAGERIRVYDTHGHTNCSVSYYFEDEELLVTSESSGFLFGDILCPAFLTSYRDSMASIALVERLAAPHLLIPHAGLISGDEAKAYPAAIRRETEQNADFILSRYRAGMSEEDILAEYTAEYFDALIRDTGLQPRESFEANAEALIPRLIKEYSSSESKP
jgi:glyoxylase-like metal-dependent hydrolase (beta-lactamase superfamily II)